MTNTLEISVQFFCSILFLSSGVFFLRTSPLFQRHGGLVGSSWSEWLSLHIREKLDDQLESPLARLVRLITLLTKYTVCAWGIINFKDLTPSFWTLFWVVILVLSILRKVCQFESPEKWEHVSIKLDAEHFWLIHLSLVGMTEIQIPSRLPYGILSLVCFYIIFNGESGRSFLSAFEDVVRVSLGVLALWSLAGTSISQITVINFFSLMAVFFVGRGILRAMLGRDWLRRRFWWISQFCFLTSLIIKSLAVLDVFPAGLT